MAARNPSSITRWSRLLSHYRSPKISPPLIRTFSICLSPNPNPIPKFGPCRHFSASTVDGYRIVEELLAEVEREKQREREQKKKAGIEIDEEEEEEEEDYMGVQPLIEKVDKKLLKEVGFTYENWEPTDSETEEEERWRPEEVRKRAKEFEMRSKKHGELLRNFALAETFDDAHKWMTKIDKFEQQHLKLPLEYRVIGELMNRLKVSTGKERFSLLQKLNRAVKLMEIKESYDPNDPANSGIIKRRHFASPDEVVDNIGFEKEKAMIQGADMEEDDEFIEAKENDDLLMQKLNAIEKKIEEKLGELDHTFGKKGRVLEEEIRDLVEERNSLTARKRMPLYRKGFDVRTLDVNRTVKVTKGGRLVKYTAILVTGNYHGVVGFAKAKAPKPNLAIQRAREKCFQNLHYVDRHEGHTIAHAINSKYGRTMIYLWPAPMMTGLRAGNTVETILHVAGFSNVKSKIHGSTNPLNVVKALFKALNAIETPKDVQEKFGRTVVESYLL